MINTQFVEIKTYIRRENQNYIIQVKLHHRLNQKSLVTYERKRTKPENRRRDNKNPRFGVTIPQFLLLQLFLASSQSWRVFFSYFLTQVPQPLFFTFNIFFSFFFKKNCAVSLLAPRRWVLGTQAPGHLTAFEYSPIGT